MARPVNADAQATRQRVLDSASALFSSQGVGGTSVREVAKGAGVSLAMVHHYFGSKAGLYESCIASMYTELEEMRDALEPVFLAPGHLGERVEAVIRTAFQFCLSHRAAVTLLMRSSVDRGELEPHWQREKHLPLLGQVSRVLADVLDCDDSRARLLFQSLNHLVVRYALSSPREMALVTGIHLDPTTEPSEAAKREAVLRIEDHLVEVARGMLDPAFPASSTEKAS